jgi:hypothetical protein
MLEFMGPFLTYNSKTRISRFPIQHKRWPNEKIRGGAQLVRQLWVPFRIGLFKPTGPHRDSSACYVIHRLFQHPARASASFRSF